MITIDNYFDKEKEFDFPSFPEALNKGHGFVNKATANGLSWDSYHSSEAIKKTIDIYLVKLNEFLSQAEAKGKTPVNRKASTAPAGKDPKPAPAKKAVPPKRQPATVKSTTSEAQQPQLVERIPEELRFIRRFVNLNGKTKTKEYILRFVNSLQKAIVEKRIRKNSVYAEQIRHIQSKLIDVFNSMGSKIKLELRPETFEEMKDLIGQEKVLPSVGLIKSYINLNGKPGMKKKADSLLARITRMMEKKLIPANDPYGSELSTIRRNLESFLDNPGQKVLSIEKNELNGLEGILGCTCNPLNGPETKPSIMNSMDFANLQFETIGLKGKWLELIGDPSSNFTAMVFGKPKMGKSYLCIEFAGYLARNHGKVLYVAKEEGLDMTLQKKLNDKDVAHPNLFVASVLPADLSAYDFIFLDSVNKLGLTPDDLSRLKNSNPSKSFIYIFQTTKLGAFRGANTFQHDVDVVIEVPERGKAVQNGRFNQGGQMNIF